MTAKGFLQGRHCVVTGAGTGIGRAIALRLGAAGARLSLMARDTGRLDETLAQLSAAGAPLANECGALAVDVRDRAGVGNAFECAVAERGPLHAAIANSGIGGPNEAGDEDRFEDLVATNLTGTYWTLRAAEACLEPSPGGRHLIAVSSILARFGVPGYTGYCASKAGVLGLVRALAMELAPSGVQVNAVVPGWVETRMATEGLEGMAAGMDVSLEKAHEIAMSAVPLGRMGQPAEVAGLVAYLLSDDARGITGQGLDMNGGAWMG